MISPRDLRHLEDSRSGTDIHNKLSGSAREYYTASTRNHLDFEEYNVISNKTSAYAFPGTSLARLFRWPSPAESFFSACAERSWPGQTTLGGETLRSIYSRVYCWTFKKIYCQAFSTSSTLDGGIALFFPRRRVASAWNYRENVFCVVYQDGQIYC